MISCLWAGIIKEEIICIFVKAGFTRTAASHKADIYDSSLVTKLMQMGVCGLINVKLMKCGGLYNALKIATAEEIYGMKCMLGCMPEVKISVNAVVQCSTRRISPSAMSSAWASTVLLV